MADASWCGSSADAVTSHAALSKLCSLQTELDELRRQSSAEISRLSEALTEARAETDVLRSDLELAERAADGRWRAASRVVWRWRVRSQLRKAHLETASRLQQREERLAEQERESAEMLRRLADASHGLQQELRTSLSDLSCELSVATAQLHGSQQAVGAFEAASRHERDESRRLAALAASAQDLVLQLLHRASDAQQRQDQDRREPPPVAPRAPQQQHERHGPQSVGGQEPPEAEARPGAGTVAADAACATAEQSATAATKPALHDDCSASPADAASDAAADATTVAAAPPPQPSATPRHVPSCEAIDALARRAAMRLSQAQAAAESGRSTATAHGGSVCGNFFFRLAADGAPPDDADDADADDADADDADVDTGFDTDADVVPPGQQQHQQQHQQRPQDQPQLGRASLPSSLSPASDRPSPPMSPLGRAVTEPRLLGYPQRLPPRTVGAHGM